jgi:hypothetical protein
MVSLREVFIDWLTSSRYIGMLEVVRREQRRDFLERLLEQKQRIRGLEAENQLLKEECARLRFGVVSPPRVPSAPRPYTGPLDWQSELDRELKKLKEEDDGTLGNGRQEIYEPAADDGAQPIA